MANTLSKLYVHIIFAVKGRYGFLPTHLLPDIHAYMASVVRNLGHKCIRIGGTENHVHLLIEYNINKLIPDLVHDLKIAVSHYINEKHIVKGRFQWQRGYAALSYSKSAIPDLIDYISNQYEHHKGRSLNDEIRLFLDRYEIEYDDRYIFDDE